MDAVLRVVIGSIAAALLVCLVQSRAITFEIGAAKLDESGVVWLYVTIIAFIGGFSERLVPDLLGKIAAEPNNANTAASGAAPAAGPVAAGASAAAAPAIAAASEHAADHEREHDACLSEIDLAPGETTPDSELPAAVGGVATARG